MASFFQSFNRNGIFQSWKESRRKSRTGWILLSMGGIIFVLSFLMIKYSLELILVSIIPALIGFFFIVKGKLDWQKTVKEFQPTNDHSLLDIFNRKIQSLPYVVVYESENPTQAAAIFTSNHSFILPLTSKGDIQTITGKMLDQMNRILPLPWQQPTVLDPVHDAMELEAAIHRIDEESPNSSITLTMLETVGQFAKVIQSFLLIGRPLPHISGISDTEQTVLSTAKTQKKPIRKKSISVRFNIRRFTWLVVLCALIAISYGIYYFSGQTGPTPESTYLDEFKLWIAAQLPLEYHSYIGLGKLEDNVEQSIKANTLRSTTIFDKVGGGQALNHVAANVEVSVIQEELAGNTYWYYIQKDNIMGWAKDSDLVFKHRLPAKTAYYRLPAIKESQISPERPIPFAIKQKYTLNGEEWWGIRGFEPITDVVWVRKGDYK